MHVVIPGVQRDHPKTIGALLLPVSFGPLVAPRSGFLISCLFPLVLLSEQLTKPAHRVEIAISHARARNLGRDGTQSVPASDISNGGESRVFDALIRFSEITVGDV